MTIEQWASLLTAVAGVLAAVAGILHSRATRSQLQSHEIWTGKRHSTEDRKTPKR